MPRFFFNTRDGRAEMDEEGIDLPDAEAACREAVRFGAVDENGHLCATVIVLAVLANSPGIVSAS